MTVQDYLLKFRKISSLESLEKLYDHLNYTLTDDQELINMYPVSYTHLTLPTILLV